MTEENKEKQTPETQAASQPPKAEEKPKAGVSKEVLEEASHDPGVPPALKKDVDAELKRREETPKPVEPPKVRIFVYDGREFQDPDPKMTTEEVRQYYTTFFPELANAEILPAVVRPSKTAPGTQEQVIEFKRRTGTKGR